MADQEQLAILRKGAPAWNAWRASHPTIIHPDLSRADLGGAHLHGADLRKADLTKADLGGAHLPNTTAALPSLRASTSVSDPPAVAAAYVYSGQLSLGVRAKVAAGINPQGKCNCSTSTTVALPILRVFFSVSDVPAVAAAYVYSG